ncbi:NAD(P)H-dependent oxidoreductase [Streptomyces durbertensis]|uniref:FMN dependent NADH:quinone oxidoreductase n=1 Tax=Streptomyces durbertensis TaxID=2448886 RepID=A0ABR6EG35_9ACTN|nr:NAD(P)H-dependent oxidoreductase [Streptomyces durbertensis]MBB1244123.1 NAD(P)H-dependent oxidoreductase [Streptomyces durbertensis]
MATLLHIDSSPTPHSVSRQLAAEFRAVWDEQHPTSGVTHRDLVADPVPHLDADGVATLLSAPADDRQRAAAALHDQLVDELLGADALLVSAPMYNWSLPSGLKAWLDQTLVMGRTLPTDPAANPLAGRPATIVLAYGGEYRPDTEEGRMNHLEPYLRTVFETVLGYDLAVVAARSTLAAPEYGASPEDVRRRDESRAAASAEVRERARSTANRFALV